MPLSGKQVYEELCWYHQYLNIVMANAACYEPWFATPGRGCLAETMEMGYSITTGSIFSTGTMPFLGNYFFQILHLNVVQDNMPGF